MTFGVVIQENWKRYLISSLRVFVATFLVFVAPQFLSMDLNNLDKGALYSLLVAGISAGLKALWELWRPKE